MDRRNGAGASRGAQTWPTRSSLVHYLSRTRGRPPEVVDSWGWEFQGLVEGMAVPIPVELSQLLLLLHWVNHVPASSVC